MDEHVTTKTTIDTEHRAVLDNGNWTLTADEIDDFPHFEYARRRAHPKGASFDGSDDGDRGSPAGALMALLGGFVSARDEPTQLEILVEGLESFVAMCCDAGAIVEDELRGLALEDDSEEKGDASDHHCLEVWADRDELVGLAFVPEEE